MSDNPEVLDPIPEEFASYEEAAEFWKTDDTTDYPDAFETVQLEAAKLRRRCFEVQIDEDLMQVLSQQAQQRGMRVSQWVNTVLRENVESAS